MIIMISIKSYSQYKYIFKMSYQMNRFYRPIDQKYVSNVMFL